MNVNKIFASAIVAAGVAMPALAQYTYEFRIIADGDAGAPTGAWAQQPLSTTATAIGFWLQARVSQTTGTNYGIGRVTSPAVPGVSFLTVTDATGSQLNRGAINGTATQHGRGAGFRSGGVNVGAAGNAAGSGAFPSTTNNQNGGLDSGNTRIYGFDAYVGATRTGTLDPDTGESINPWGVNGSATAGSVASGFSPWANIYRFVVLPTNSNSQRVITLNANAQLNGTLGAQETSPGSNSWALQLAPGVTRTAQYSFNYGIPTPGAAALLGLGGLAAARRRRA